MRALIELGLVRCVERLDLGPAGHRFRFRETERAPVTLFLTVVTGADTSALGDLPEAGRLYELNLPDRGEGFEASNVEEVDFCVYTLPELEAWATDLESNPAGYRATSLVADATHLIAQLGRYSVEQQRRVSAIQARVGAVLRRLEGDNG